MCRRMPSTSVFREFTIYLRIMCSPPQLGKHMSEGLQNEEEAEDLAKLGKTHVRGTTGFCFTALLEQLDSTLLEDKLAILQSIPGSFQ